MLKKLVSIDNTGIEEFVADELNTLAEEVIFYRDYPIDEEEILKRLEGADGMLVSWNTKVPKEILEKTQLKYIGLCCSLITPEASNVDVTYALKNNMTVTDVKHYGDEGVVEFIISEVIQLIKGLKGRQLFSEQVELSDLSLGIVGMGILGQKVARAAEAFGMKVYYHSRNPKDVEYPYLSLEAMVRACDVITTHLPRHVEVFTKEMFDQFGPNKIFINTGLTPSYDQEAFQAWIQKPHHHAIIDRVSLSEALYQTYQKYDNISLSTHVTGFTKTARRRLAQTVANNLKNYTRKSHE